MKIVKILKLKFNIKSGHKILLYYQNKKNLLLREKVEGILDAQKLTCLTKSSTFAAQGGRMTSLTTVFLP